MLSLPFPGLFVFPLLDLDAILAEVALCLPALFPLRIISLFGSLILRPLRASAATLR